MTKNFSILFITCALFIVACATVDTQDINVGAEADPKVQFSGYKTYTWLGSAQIIYDPVGKWEPPKFDADTEIKFLIDRELRKRGMAQTTSNPDVIVLFAAGIDMEALQLKENPESTDVILKKVPQGALIIALIDSSTGYVMWRGTATGNIQKTPSQEAVRKRLDYAVTKVLKLLPK